MNNKKNQLGIGLVEVMVSLLILAIAILGFAALQYRAGEATIEAGYRIQAINLARDLSERIRINREEFETYKDELSTASKQREASKNCDSEQCTAAELADFDIAQVVAKANVIGMTMNIMQCQNTTNNRNCIYVAWNDTSATDGENLEDCTNGVSYNKNSSCLIMETY